MINAAEPGAFTIGIAALHGDCRSHKDMLLKLNVAPTNIKLVKKSSDFDEIDGLIIPGGESTTMGLLAERFGIFDSLRAFVASEKPVWGTCAGLIFLADKLVDKSSMEGQKTAGGLHVTVYRNYFGSQGESFVDELKIKDLADDKPFRCVFIRAPAIEDLGEDVEVLAYVIHTNLEGKETQRPVAVRQGNLLGTSFHPELTTDTRVHQYFLDVVLAAKKIAN